MAVVYRAAFFVLHTKKTTVTGHPPEAGNKTKNLKKMKRNLCIAALAALALCLPLTMTGATPQKKTAKKATKPAKEICLQLYSVRDLLNDINPDGKASEKWTGLLSRLHKMGYTTTEAANYDQAKGTFYNRTPKEYRQDIENAGMKVLSSHVAHGISDEHLAKGDYSEELNWWKKCIADHKAAGIKYLVNPWIGPQKSLKDLDLYCKYLNDVGKLCKDAGITFGYHNHNYEFEKIEGTVMYDYMLEHTNPDFVFFQMDLYWVVRGAASPTEYFKRYPGRFKMYHVKDHREIGQSGMVGYDACFKNASTAGLQYIVAEIEQYTMPVEESVKQSADYLLNASFVKASYATAK